MTSQPMDVFAAAKAICDALKGMDKTEQEKAIKWAAEQLGLQAPAVPTPQAPKPGQQHSLLGADQLPIAPAPGKGVDIKTFIQSKQPKSDQQFAACVAFFHKFEAPPPDRHDAINAQLLMEAVRLTNWNRPKKPSFTLNNAKNQGYLDALGSGEYSINSVGENLVVMTLPRSDRQTNARKGRRKSARQKPGKSSKPKTAIIHGRKAKAKKH